MDDCDDLYFGQFPGWTIIRSDKSTRMKREQRIFDANALAYKTLLNMTDNKLEYIINLEGSFLPKKKSQLMFPSYVLAIILSELYR